MHARKMFNFFFIFISQNHFLEKKWKYAMQNEINVFFSKINYFFKQKVCEKNETNAYA